MKTLLKLSFTAFIFVAFSCSENKVQIQEPSDAKPILEISQQARGLRDITGEIAYFRLYSDKSFEYEYFDEKKKTKNLEKAEVNSLMKGILNEKEFQKIAGIINSGNFLI